MKCFGNKQKVWYWKHSDRLGYCQSGVDSPQQLIDRDPRLLPLERSQILSDAGSNTLQKCVVLISMWLECSLTHLYS